MKYTVVFVILKDNFACHESQSFLYHSVLKLPSEQHHLTQHT